MCKYIMPEPYWYEQLMYNADYCKIDYSFINIFLAEFFLSISICNLTAKELSGFDEYTSDSYLDSIHQSLVESFCARSDVTADEMDSYSEFLTNTLWSNALYGILRDFERFPIDVYDKVVYDVEKRYRRLIFHFN